jgi:hypothetical protein
VGEEFIVSLRLEVYLTCYFKVVRIVKSGEIKSIKPVVMNVLAEF